MPNGQWPFVISFSRRYKEIIVLQLHRYMSKPRIPLRVGVLFALALLSASLGSYAMQDPNAPLASNAGTTATADTTHSTSPAISAPSSLNVKPAKPAKDSTEEKEMQLEQSQRQFGI